MHPNIVATYDTGDDNGTAYIVMELVDGPTLRRILDDVGRLPVRDVIRIGEQVADALDAAHRAGLVHRDVKPANVLVPDERPGQGHRLRHRQGGRQPTTSRAPGTVMGTARYLAPEQVNGHATDARTDVYALGLADVRDAVRPSAVRRRHRGRDRHGPPHDLRAVGARRSARRAGPHSTTSCTAASRAKPDAGTSRRAVHAHCAAAHTRFAFAHAAGSAFGHAAAPRSGTQPAPRSGTQPAPRPAAATARPSAKPAPVAPVVHPAPVAVKRRKGSGWIWVVLAVLVVLGLAAAAVYLGTKDNSSGGSGSANSAAGASPVVVDASAFDPFGDGQEDNAHTGQAVDGDVTTAWSTEHYNDPLQNTKKGVGTPHRARR